MTSKVNEPPDGGGDDKMGPMVENDATKDMVDNVSSIDTVTGEPSLGSYAFVASHAMTNPWGLDGKKCLMRDYGRIVEASKEEVKNILNVKIEKIRSRESVLGLTHEDVENILFNELKIDIDAVEEVDVTSKYNFKEIIFKKDHDVIKYQRPPFIYKGHIVTAGTNSKLRNMVKITFRNVPRSVPDEELVHFCKSFGMVEDKTVYYGKFLSGNFKGLYNGTRWLNIELNCRVPINFIWLEGPEDQESTRVTVTLGAGGETQCGHCLRTKAEGCPGAGKAKICKTKGEKRADVEEYMKVLKEKYLYKTLKEAYLDSLKEKNEKQMGTEEEQQNASEENKEQDLKKENEKLKEKLKVLDEKVASHEKREVNMNSLRKTILKNLEESLAEPLFADSNMSKLVAQFSLSLKDEEFSTDEQGLVILNDLIFKGMKLASDDVKENETIRSNFAAFKKAVKQNTSVKISKNGDRRLSIGQRTQSPKRVRSPSDEDNGSNAKKAFETPKSTGIPMTKSSSSKASWGKPQSLTTHHQTK